MRGIVIALVGALAGGAGVWAWTTLRAPEPAPSVDPALADRVRALEARLAAAPTSTQPEAVNLATASALPPSELPPSHRPPTLTPEGAVYNPNPDAPPPADPWPPPPYNDGRPGPAPDPADFPEGCPTCAPGG